MSSLQQQEYIRSHNLAVLVDTLIQQLLHEKPTDPYGWLADRIRLERALRKKNRSMAPTLADGGGKSSNQSGP